LLPPLLNLICVSKAADLLCLRITGDKKMKKKKIREATEGTDCRNSCLFLSWVQNVPVIKQGQPTEVLLVINWTRLFYLDEFALKLALML